MNQIKTILFFSALFASIGGLATSDASLHAQPPRMQNADLDFAASGYMMPPGANPANAVRQAGMVGQMAGSRTQMAGGPTQYAPTGYAQPMPSQSAPANIAQVGFMSGGSGGCDAGCCGGGGGGGCDSMSCGQMGGAPMGGGYGGQYGMGMMPGACGSNAYQNCDPILTGGIVGKMRGEGGSGSGGENLSGLRHLCMFCRGGGCSACQSFRPGALLGALAALKPYAKGGLCAQRWFDLSAEAVFLGHNAGGIGGGVTSQGIGGPIVLSSGDTGANDLEAGIRLSGAIIMGPGGNLEATYMGGQEWGGSARVDDSTGQLFSFISDFGALPSGNGFDDTDRSTSQSISASSKFHSGELNYRRRTVGPYCRFQGSWLAGMRYLRFDNKQRYQTVGGPTTTAGFFDSDAQAKNSFFGAQLGGDLWWNMIPGVSLGVGLKGAWGQNDYSTQTQIQSNSSGIPSIAANGGLTFTEDQSDITVMTEFQLKSMYRLSRDWTFRSAYYLIAMEDAAQAGLSLNDLRGLVDPSVTAASGTIGSEFSSLVVQGFSFGAEYTW